MVLDISNYRHFCCDLSLHIVCRPEWDVNPGHWISGCNGYTSFSICLPQVCLFSEMFKYNIQCTVQCCYWYTNNTVLNWLNECASCLCIWPKRKNKICVSALMLLTDWITACPMALYSCIKKSTVGKIKICDNLNNMQVPGPLLVNAGHNTPQTCNSIPTTVEFACSMKEKEKLWCHEQLLYLYM